jgi:hypothetical protein
MAARRYASQASEWRSWYLCVVADELDDRLHIRATEGADIPDLGPPDDATLAARVAADHGALPPHPPRREPPMSMLAHVVRQITRLLLFPILRFLEPRLADTNRRVDDTRRSLHEESSLTRWVQERDSRRIETALDTYAATSTEAMAFVGTQLRELHDEVRELSGQVEELLERLERLEHASEPTGGSSSAASQL